MKEDSFVNNLDYNVGAKFSSSLNTFDFLDENGNIIDNPATYLEEKAKSMITYEGKCMPGDVVVLKGTELHIRITEVDYKTDGGIVFDYAGYNIFESDNKKYLFLQRDIKSIVSQKHR